ncbi:MAG: vWA domain-containing protein [Gammaproteobacteria bacterium]
MNTRIITLSLVLLLMQACNKNSDQALLEEPSPKSSEELVSQVQAVKPDRTQHQPGVISPAPLPLAESSLVQAQEHKRKAYDQAANMMGRSYIQDYRMPLPEYENRENYAHFSDNPLHKVSEQPVSTFSIDVDTGAYSNMRRMLNQGQLPVADAIRTEELINYFSYDYPSSHVKDQPFTVTTEVAATPWNKHTQLLHIGLQGYVQDDSQLPPANLVFLIDVSGSMQSQDKLPLLKSGLKLLVKQLDKNDRMAMVVYAGASGVVLDSTTGDQHMVINLALDKLAAGGSTNGASGIELAYQMAAKGFIKGGINRILLATDGDFNVGVTHFETLKQMVADKRQQGIALSTLGFGRGNYNDHLLEQLADVGNGNYSYIDTLKEARKVLVEQMAATLNIIARDVKIQVEFNPAQVTEYRLIGYENRHLNREDFNNDKVDAGDIGAGHTVTALYEITLTGSAGQRIDDLRYQAASIRAPATHGEELAYVRLRYKRPNQDSSQLLEHGVMTSDIQKQLNQTSERFRFAAAVAAFGQQLRGGTYMEDFDYDDILSLARQSRGKDLNAYRGEFIQLVALAKTLN